jgi:hypothetical protein
MSLERTARTVRPNHVRDGEVTAQTSRAAPIAVPPDELAGGTVRSAQCGIRDDRDDARPRRVGAAGHVEDRGGRETHRAHPARMVEGAR